MKKIVFDLGNVIVRFEPMAIYYRYVDNEEDAKQLYDILMRTKLWEKLDYGIDPHQVISEAQAISSHHLHSAISKIILNWVDALEIDYQMEEYIYELSELGFDIYLLSNTSTQINSLLETYPLFDKMKGRYLSAETNLLKPDLEIYEDFCKRFNLDPTECIFIDDRIENAKGAKQYGMDSYHYQFDLENLKQYIKEKTSQ